MAKDPEQPNKPEETKGESQEKKVSRRAFARKAVGVGLGVIAGAFGAQAGRYVPPQVGDIGRRSSGTPKPGNKSLSARGTDKASAENCAMFGFGPVGTCNIGESPFGHCGQVGNTPSDDCINGNTPMSGGCLAVGTNPPF